MKLRFLNALFASLLILGGSASVAFAQDSAETAETTEDSKQTKKPCKDGKEGEDCTQTEGQHKLKPSRTYKQKPDKYNMEHED